MGQLSSLCPIAYCFPNTDDGYKLLFGDGVFCEFAVFEPLELQAIPFAPGRIVWRQAHAQATLLYPERKRFHVSEVVSFMGVVGLYFYATRRRDLAQQHYAVLQKLAPGHPVTRELGRRLSPSLLVRFWRYVTHRAAL